jgi:regulator of sigma E protease
MTARRFGIRAEEFGFGFPPRGVGIYKNDQGKWKIVWGAKEVKDCPTTVYSLNWIPMGGFVKIKGEDGEFETDADSFSGKKIWQRAVVLAAGVSMNVILAIVLISFGLMIGMPQDLESLAPGAKVDSRQIQVIHVLPNTPANQAGLVVGDSIVSINGQIFSTYQELQKFVDNNTGKNLVYQIKHEGQVKDYPITPELMKETGKGGIGVALVETGIVRYPWYRAVWQGTKTTFELIGLIFTAFFELFRSLIMGKGVTAEVAGPVGIASLTGQAARMGFIYLLQFAALLSLNLAIINILPFPALDGGRILFLIIEKFKGGPVKKEVEGVIHNIGFALLMVLVTIVTFRDVLKFGDKFIGLWHKTTGIF